MHRMATPIIEESEHGTQIAVGLIKNAELVDGNLLVDIVYSKEGYKDCKGMVLPLAYEMVVGGYPQNRLDHSE